MPGSDLSGGALGSRTELPRHDPSQGERSDLGASRVTRSRVTKNSLYTLAAYAVNLPLSLFVSRFVVHRIGLSAFGIWAALTMVMSFASLLDLGVTTPLIKYTSEYMTGSRERDVNTLLNTCMLFYFVVSGVFVGLAALSSGWVLVHLFHVSPGNMQLRVLYLAVIIGFWASLTFSVLQSLLTGLQRADLVGCLALLFNVLGAVGNIVTLSLGMGINGLATTWLAVTALTIGANWAVAKRHFPALQLDPRLFSWRELRRIMGFSTRIQATTVTLFLNDQVDRTLIAYALGPASLGFYQLAARAAIALRGVSFSLLAGFVAVSSDLAATSQHARLQRLCLRATKYIATVDYGLFAGVACLAQPFVWAWLGPGYGRVAQTMVLILAGYAVWIPTQPTSEALNGLGRPEIRMRADLAFLCLHIPLSVFLIWRFGYFGTIVGTTFALAFTRLYLYVVGPRIIGVSPATLVRRSLLHPAIAALLASASVLALEAVTHISWGWLCAEIALFASVYLSYAYFLILDDNDRHSLTSCLPAIARLKDLVLRASGPVAYYSPAGTVPSGGLRSDSERPAGFRAGIIREADPVRERTEIE
jgi:O-antigen/teichoic acid export membrane protein